MVKKKILLVDDEPRVTRLLRMHLEKTGAYDVKEVNQGGMALSVARQCLPDFILLDVVLPDMDGGEVAANMAADERLKNIPIVFLTATVAKQEEGIIAGYPFIAKPATGGQVIDCIQQHLGSIPNIAEPQPAPSSDATLSRPYLVPILIILLLGLGYFSYLLYARSEHSQNETFKEIQKTRDEISSLQSSAAQAIRMQQDTINRQGVSLAEKNHNLQKMKKIERLLQETLKNMEEARVSNLISRGVTPSLLNGLAPSVVKLFCLANSHSDTIQKGSGFLYRASNDNTRLPLYYVQTNLHVIQMEDRPSSNCRIILYPDYTDSKSYLLYKSQGYKSYDKEIDIAFLDPQIVTNDLKGGTWNDLVVYARDEIRNPICDSVDIGDHLSILGYPGVGGETLTVTEGIVSGFELNEKSRYVKTSAKTDHGNSGGIAIKDSGCVIGIPTWSRRGNVDSIGLILELNYLHKETAIYLTLR